MPSWLKKSDKSEKGDDLESKKSSLFGSRKAANSPATTGPNPYAQQTPSNNPHAQQARNPYAQQSSNPYAQQSSNPYAQQSSNPYARQNGASDPYAPQSQSALTTPPASSFGNLTLKSQGEPTGPPAYGSRSTTPNPSEKSAVPPGGYGGGAPRYQSQSEGGYGRAGGYDSNPYGAQPSQPRTGGYGSLGRSNSQSTTDTDAGRNALFEGAAQRAQHQRGQAPTGTETSDPSYSNSGAYGSEDMPGSYGYGADPGRELTQEEQEDQDVIVAKTEMKHLKYETEQSQKRGLAALDAMIATGSGSLAMLNEQGDRIHATERNLDNAAQLNKIATQRTKTLQKVDGSMMGFSAPNPFTRKKHKEAAIAQEVLEHQQARTVREETAQRTYTDKARQEDARRNLERGNGGNPTQKQRNLAQRVDYQFEADSDDDATEDRIEDNVEAMLSKAKIVRQIADAQGREIEEQIQHIGRIALKTESVDDQIANNNARLRRIR